MATLDEIKALREKTGAGINDCKEALEKSSGDNEKAIKFLREKGILKAQKRADKVTKSGIIASYVHNGYIGVLVELRCETDFVARNEKFKNLADEIALHVAASNPKYLKKEDVPESEVNEEREIIKKRLIKEGKPENLVEKISEGFMNKFFEEICLLEQNYVRDEKKKIKHLIEEAVSAYGEKIEISRFVRIVLGE